MKIEVGAKIRMTPTSLLEGHDFHSKLYRSVKDMEGTIIDVNRKHRHYTVEYEFPNGMKFRETFKMKRAKTVAVHTWTVGESNVQ